MTDKRLRSRRVRLYETVRSAHLERAHELSPAAIVHRHRRYDFDAALLDGLEIVQASRWAAARLISRSSPEVLEINEPLMLAGAPTAALTVFMMRLRRARTRIVTYVIGNADPFTMPPPRGAKAKVRTMLDRRLASYLWRRVDRVVFGTDAAEAVYTEVLGTPRRAQVTRIPALPARDAGVPTGPRPPRVVFLGAFVPRKGLLVVLAAWPLVRMARPEARLLVMGKGALEGDVRALVGSDASVELQTDPPRDVIRAELAASRVLVLPSQPTPTWREQVGLPIVEGLEQGCRVVATTETGLAPWLAEHGHGIVDVPTTPDLLAEAIVAQLDATSPVQEVMQALPARDGRLAADDVLFA